MSYDIIIVGGGISGLYARWKLSTRFPTVNILLMEKKDSLGGRIKQRPFGGATVQLGAGVIRTDKDVILMQLIREMGLQLNRFTSKPKYAVPYTNVANVIKTLGAHIDDASGKSFEHWIGEHLSESESRRFVWSMGYTDMLDADAAHTFRYYGLDDNDFTKPHQYGAIGGGWMAIIDRLYQKGRGDVRLSTQVERISREHDGSIVVDSSMGTFGCKTLLLCTTRMMFDQVNFLSDLSSIPPVIDRSIGSVPFVRIYVKLNGSISASFPDILIVDGPCRKLIPIDRQLGVLMMAYADSADALYWRTILESGSKSKVKRELNRHLSSISDLRQGTKVLFYLGTFWRDGIHYFNPNEHPVDLVTLQNPVPDVFSGGEMVAQKQGWVNGAIESTQRVVSMIESTLAYRY